MLKKVIPSHLSLGLLKCDTFVPEVLSEFGDIDVQFKQLLNSNTLGTKVDLTVFECVKDEFPARDEILKREKGKFQGFIISGSRSSVNDDFPWISKLKSYIRLFDENSIRTVGICFGHQAIATAFNGTVVTNEKGWQVSDQTFKINSKSEVPELVVSFEKLYKEASHSTPHIICSNKQIVDRVPDNFQVLGSNELCPNHMMVKGNQFLSVQGHPEYTPKLISSILKLRRGLIPDPVIDDGLKRSEASKIPQHLYANMIITFLSP